MKIPDEFPNQFESKGYFIFDEFLNEAQTKMVRSEMLSLQNSSLFRKAGIGKQEEFRIDSNERGDFILWIEPEKAPPATTLFIEKITDLMRQFNRLFYMGIKEYECHYAIYPERTFYKKHVDRHHKSSPRIVSFVFYLNENWKEDHGGQLRIYEDEENSFDVGPEAGRLVVFLSEKEHEVLVTTQKRMSITGWMLNE